MRATPSTGRTDAGRRLRGRKIVAWIATLIVVCAVTSFSSGTRPGGYGVPLTPSAVHSPTTPLSSYEGGLVATANPIDSSSALVVTGNVGGGKHFQGSVPYRPLTSIDAPLGSTSIDPFLRRTMPSATPGDNLGASSPFYSQTGTVATGTGGGLGRGPATTYAEGQSASQYAPGPDLQLSSGSAGSLTVPAGDLATGWQSSSPSAGLSTGQDYDRQMAQLRERLARVKAEVAQLERSVETGRESSESSAQHPPVGPMHRPELPAQASRGMQVGELPPASETLRREELLQETARLLSATMGLSDSTRRRGDAASAHDDATAPFETAAAQPRLRLYEARGDTQRSSAYSSIDALVSPRTGETAGVGARRDLNELLAMQRISETSRAFDRPSILPDRPATHATPQASRREDLPNPSFVSDRPRDAAPSQSSTAPPTHTTPSMPLSDDSPSAKAFERHLQEGRQFMQRRDYRRAAEAFTLASAYRPHDVRAHLGKGHACLAAGEYLDSALCVAKAVELDLPCVLQRTDLIQLVGGPDAFIAHFNELDRRIEADGGPHLQLLMAYIYYQMDRPTEAKAAIDAAQRLLPASIPIDLLRGAIGQ
jgi:tetratricopeptide (TPR) repeat protein